jgi:lactam utilization protein B
VGSRAAHVQVHAALGDVLLQDFEAAAALVEAATKFSPKADGAARHRQACADALAALAQTLPEGHSAREALMSAEPTFAA